MGESFASSGLSPILSAVGVTFPIADWIVILVYFTGIVLRGIWFGKFTHTTNDFFFGGQPTRRSSGSNRKNHVTVGVKN